jgi:hypothetical protein
MPDPTEVAGAALTAAVLAGLAWLCCEELRPCDRPTRQRMVRR